uniref:ATPase 8 n=1 Tax=Masticophis flagellum TaxID=94899 RepID=G0ZM45_MASFL|nr:ATPase 8 [Masticophis flagellum]
MPQLDTVFIMMTYSWTWFMLYLMMKKIKTFIMTNPATHMTINKSTPTLQWL